MSAKTLEGFRAKGITRKFCNRSGGQYFDPGHDDAVAWSLAGDLLGLPGETVVRGEVPVSAAADVARVGHTVNIATAPFSLIETDKTRIVNEE